MDSPWYTLRIPNSPQGARLSVAAFRVEVLRFCRVKGSGGLQTSRQRVSALTATLPLADAVLLYKDLQSDAKHSGTERLKAATPRAFQRTPA